MIERIGAFNGTRFIPIDDEEMTALELIGKISDTTNKLIDSNNTNTINIEDITDKALLKRDYLVDMVDNRKLDNAGDFTGTWHGLKPSQTNEGIQSQVDKNTTELINKTEENGIYKKSIVRKFPLMFEGYAELVAQNNADYYYPQGFAVDWFVNEIFIVYSPSGPGILNSFRLIVHYNLESGELIGKFFAGAAGGEGAVIKYENEKRYLYVKSQTTKLGKYPIPTSYIGDTVNQVENVGEIDCGLYYNFNFYDNNWIIEQGGSSLGALATRNIISIYDSTFNDIKGFVQTSLNDSGYWGRTYQDFFPKRQGIALDNKYIYQSMGGYWGVGGKDIPYCYQGLRIFDLNGDVVKEGLMHPQKMAPILLQNNVKCTRIEHEGINVSTNSNDIYSMVVTLSRFDKDATSEGVVIFKEFATTNYIDFSPAKISNFGYEPYKFDSGIFPRHRDGKMYNPITGDLLDTIEKIIYFMRDTDMKSFYFYSSAVAITDINKNSIPSTKLVELRNLNNLTFTMKWDGDTQEEYFIYRKGDMWEQKAIKKRDAIQLSENIVPFYDGKIPGVEMNDKRVSLSGYVKGLSSLTAFPKTIANIPEIYRPDYNHSFVVALSGSLEGGYGIIQIYQGGNIVVTYLSKDVDYVSLDGVSYILS